MSSDIESDHSGLALPSEQEVDRALDLERADDTEAPGLYRINVVKTPIFRLVFLNVLAASVFAHNLVRSPEVPVFEFMPMFVGFQLYALLSWLFLFFFFERVTRVHLGNVVLLADLVPFGAAIAVSGAEWSWLWPIFLLRVADQLYSGRRWALLLSQLGPLTFLGAVLIASGLQDRAVDWSVAGTKIVFLWIMGVYLVRAAQFPWELKDRALAAKGLIMQLERQSVELDEARRKAEEASQSKSEFLARMSHELRTPMNSVIGFTNVLAKKISDRLNPKEADFLERIRQNGMHLLAMINDVLDIAKIEEGKLEVTPVEVDVGPLVRSTVSQLEDRTMGTRLALEVSIPSGLGIVVADEARLRQVLINLVGNGLKFTEEGVVRVEVHAEAVTGRPLRIDVSDTGIGIPPDRLEDVFVAFEQGDGSTTRKYQGSGLGLAISRSLCELMGFELSARSEVGVGSVFTIDFGKGPSTPTRCGPHSHG